MLELPEVYRREGQSCFRCGAEIKRLKLFSRSAHYKNLVTIKIYDRIFK